MLEPIDYTAIMASGFISKSKFQEEIEKDKVLNWIDLEEGKIFRIKKIEPKVGKFGDCAILTIEDEDGEEARVWSPSQLYKRLQEKKGEATPYFTSLGQARVKNKVYNNFDLILRDEEEVPKNTSV